MNKTKQILRVAKEKGIIQAKDLEELGLKRHHLYSLYKKGLLVKCARGLYMLPNAPITENQSLIEVAKRIPAAVICLISALKFYEITTQLPHEVWIALPRDTWRPRITHPPIKYIVLTKKTYEYGIVELNIHGVEVKMYNLAKTISDCFKYRNKVGIDVAIEALRESLRTQKVTMNQLVEAAKINRVLNIMRPYMEAIV